MLAIGDGVVPEGQIARCGDEVKRDRFYASKERSVDEIENGIMEVDFRVLLAAKSHRWQEGTGVLCRHSGSASACPATV